MSPILNLGISASRQLSQKGLTTRLQERSWKDGFLGKKRIRIWFDHTRNSEQT